MNNNFRSSKLNPRNPRILGEPTNFIAKFSPGGRFLGWYRDEQKSGMPSKAILKSETKKQEKFFKRGGLVALELVEDKFITLGKLSGISRREDSLASKIIKCYQELLNDPTIPKHQIAGKVANLVGSKARYVRKVMLKNKKMTPERTKDSQ